MDSVACCKILKSCLSRQLPQQVEMCCQFTSMWEKKKDREKGREVVKKRKNNRKKKRGRERKRGKR